MKNTYFLRKDRAAKTQPTLPKISKISVQELQKVSGGITSYGGVQMG